MAFFNSENAAYYGKMGKSVPREGFKQQAQSWIRANGYGTLLEWIKGDSERKATFALGLMFNYALGKPVEKVQIDDRKEFFVQLSKDPALNELANRFGIHPGRVLEARDGVVADGTAPLQTESPPTHSL